jgi:hypothetical protein
MRGIEKRMSESGGWKGYVFWWEIKINNDFKGDCECERWGRKNKCVIFFFFKIRYAVLQIILYHKAFKIIYHIYIYFDESHPRLDPTTSTTSSFKLNWGFTILIY